MTKEDFLDKKNIEIIKQVKHALDLKEEIGALSHYFQQKRKENPGLYCGIQRRRVKGLYVSYVIHDVFISMVEMLEKGELIYKPKNQ